jgi:AcrR family transcriptional regulator
LPDATRINILLPVGEPRQSDDAVRERLLEAAIRVFARQGYAGAKILDIVREAGLSTGAVYGRFRSKEELLREAVVAGTRHAARLGPRVPARVADLIARGAAVHDRPLSNDDAVRLEAYVAARREPEVAAALDEARAHWRQTVQPLVDAATADGTVAADLDPESVLFFVQTVHLGLLLQRGAGAEAPDPARWEQLIERVVASFGDGAPPPATDRRPDAELVAEPSAAAAAIVGPTAEPAREGR